MAAATKNRSITGPQTAGSDLPKRFDVDVAAGVRIFQGTLVARDMATAGRPARPAGVNLNYIVHGFAMRECDNTGGAQGDKVAEIQVMPGWVNNSAAGDQITDADLFKKCYVVDDQTVAKTDGGATRPVAGIILAVDATLGVLVYPHPVYRA